MVHGKNEGSHRQFKHEERPGVVTIAGKLNNDLAKGTLRSIFWQAGLKNGANKVFRFPVIIEKAEGNYSAYSPDLPGCIATGLTVRDTLLQMKTAVKFHIKAMKSDGLEIP